MKIYRNEERNFPNNPGSVSGHRMDQRGPEIRKYQKYAQRKFAQTQMCWTWIFEHAHMLLRFMKNCL